MPPSYVHCVWRITNLTIICIAHTLVLYSALYETYVCSGAVQVLVYPLIMIQHDGIDIGCRKAPANKNI